MPGERRISKRYIGLIWPFLVAVSVLICDQIAKLFAVNLIPLGTSLPVIENFFHLTLVFNSGAAFGIFKSQVLFFITVGIAAIIFISFYIPRLKKDTVLVKIGFGSILGGILGNLIDRLRFGYVVDFLDFRIWPVFNIADSAITIGAVLIVIHLLKPRT